MPADTSQTERIRRLRSTIQAVWHAECGTCQEGTESLYLSRRFGQMVYYRPDATGAAIAESCCSSAIVPTPCKPSTVAATQINYTNHFLDSIVVTFEGGPFPILLAPGQSTGLVTGITSYTINCFTPCAPSTVIFSAPTTVPYIVNTFSTPIVITILSISGGISVTLNPGQYAGPYTDVTNYTITCSSVIDITCNSQPPLPSTPNAITFTNRDVSDIVVTLFPKPIILSPGQSSDQFVNLTQYTAQCVTPVTLDLTCAAQPVPPPLFNAVTFHNTETVTTLQITLDLSGTVIKPLPFFLAPGEYSVQYLNLISYTSICVTVIPLQCNSSGTIPSGIISFTNTTSTDMLIAISSQIVFIYIIPAGGRSPPFAQFPGESYTVKCITDISLICTSSGTLTAPNAVRFINTTTDAMVITYESGTALTLTLNPGSTSSTIEEITSYSVTCISVTNVRISCSSQPPLPSVPNALTFTNTESVLPITLNTVSSGGARLDSVGSGVTTTLLINVSSYTVSCPTLLQISSCTGAQPPVPSGNFIVQNTSTSVISIAFQIPKGGTVAFILNPGEISTAQSGWSSYTVSCPTLSTVSAACGESIPIPPLSRVINFYNTSPNMMAIELLYGSYVVSIVVPANSYSPYMFTPTQCTATCPTPTTIVMACGALGTTTGITRFQNTSAYTMNITKVQIANTIPVAANSYSDYFANFGSYKIGC